MSTTRAIIAVRQPQGDFITIYVHMQGDHALETLRQHYVERQQVQTLIALGDLLSLGDSPAECVAYHRDEHEPWQVVRPQAISRIDRLARHALNLMADYIYTYDGVQWSATAVKYLARWSSHHRRYFTSKELVESLAA